MKEVTLLHAKRHDIPQIVEELHMFDSTCITLLAARIVAHRLLYRIENWNCHYDQYIKSDLMQLRRASEFFQSQLDSLRCRTIL